MFNGIWLVASEPLEIQGREIATGERFQISRIHSGALLAQGRATVAPKLPPEPVYHPLIGVSPLYACGVAALLQPEPIPETPAPRRRRPRKITTATIDAETPSVPEPSRTYQRRDLEPEP